MSKVVSNYYLSILKRHKKLLLIYVLIGFVAFPMATLISNDVHYGRGIYEFGLIMNGLFMIICGMVLPPIIYKFMLNKRSVDTYFALPIKRKHLFDVHYLAGLTAMLVPLMINFLLGVLILTVRFGLGRLPLLALFLFVFEMVAATALYSLNVFIVNKTNNLVDAVLLIAAYTILPCMAIMCLAGFIARFTVGYTAVYWDYSRLFDYFSPFTVMIRLMNYSLDKITLKDIGIFWLFYEMAMIVIFYIWSMKTFEKRQGEDSEQRSNDFFAYPLVVNLASVLLLSMYIIDFSNLTLTIGILVITFVIYLAMHFVSRRSMKVTARIVIKYFAILITFNVIALVAHKTAFFGYNYTQPKLEPYNYLVVECEFYKDGDWTSEDYSAVINLKNVSQSEQRLVEEVLNLQTIAADYKKNAAFNSNDYSDYYRSNEREEVSVFVRLRNKINEYDSGELYYHYLLPKELVGDFVENENFKPTYWRDAVETEIVD